MIMSFGDMIILMLYHKKIGLQYVLLNVVIYM